MYLCMLENYPIVASHLNNRQMNRNSTPGFNPTVARQIVWALVAIFVFVIGMAFIRPWYNVWSQEMEGKAEFAKAEQNRKIKIEEARANLEAEKLNAQAEVARAKGAAEAIKIENGSHLYPVSLGAPAERPERQDRHLYPHRDQSAHPRVDADEQNQVAARPNGYTRITK